MFFQLAGNVSAMVSTGIKITEFPIKHLAKTFYLFYHFCSKAKSKDLADFLKSTKLWVKHQNPY
jgi:hypothetical protein